MNLSLQPPESLPSRQTGHTVAAKTKEEQKETAKHRRYAAYFTLSTTNIANTLYSSA